MTPVCASCGAELTGEARFCSSCGAAVDASASREARKIVTALFADVVGSTSLGESMDPEDFKSIVGEAVARMAIAVAEFGGEVSEFAGDGLLALFGAPTAHEDDPERAVLAGLRIVGRATELAADVAKDWSIEGFAVRVGIETGLAVLGPVGGGGRVEYGAVGDALNTAARLQAAADPGTVLVGAQTHRSIAGLFDWGEPQALTLKGKAETVTAYRALAKRAGADGGVSGGAAVAAGIVGREGELAAAGELVNRVLAGSGGILVISGDAGIGKSRMVAEVRAHFEAACGGSAAAGRWLEGRCVSYGEALPYWPFRAPIRECLEAAPEAHADLLGAMLGAGEVDVTQAGLAEETPRLIGAAVAETLAALADAGPVVLALEDLHWADASSLSLLRRLFELVDSHAVLLVLTSRPERDHSSWRLREDALREYPHRAAEVALTALGNDADRSLLRALVGSATLPAELERRLLARAEGNPFYLEELVRSLVGAGALVEEEGDWRFDREVPVELPETVEKVILARIDRLSPSAHNLLGLGSVLGRQFPVALLEEVSGSAVGTLELGELQRAELVRDAGRRPVPMLAFKHTLIQETTYRSLLKRRRQDLHRRAVGAIEDLYAERIDEFLGMLAHHTSAAGDDERALEYHRRAGDAARKVYAVEEAVEHYGAVIDAARRLGTEETDPAVRHAVLQRGRLRFDGGSPAGALPDLERALAGARSAADLGMQVEALLSLTSYWRTIDFARSNQMLDEAAGLSEAADAATQVDALGRLSIQYSNQLRFDRALEAGERALRLVEDEDLGEEKIVIALDALKLVALQLGDLERLEKLTSRLIRTLAADQGDRSFYLHWVLLEAAFVPLGAGRWEEAIDLLDEALDLARRGGTKMHEPLFLDALCWTYRSRGDYERAVEQGRLASELAYEVGSNEWAAWADATLGWALLEAGAEEEAAAVLERGMRAALEGGVPAPVARCTGLLAWARAALGDLDAAGELAGRGEELLARVSVPHGRAWLFGAHAYVAVARAHLAGGAHERAEALTAPIVAAAEGSGWHEALASGLAVLGSVRAGSGDVDGARAALERALEVAERVGLPATALEAHRALEILGVAGPDRVQELPDQ